MGFERLEADSSQPKVRTFLTTANKTNQHLEVFRSAVERTPLKPHRLCAKIASDARLFSPLSGACLIQVPREGAVLLLKCFAVQPSFMCT